MPSIREQVDSVEALCTRWGFGKALFVGHSYGSVMLSWMAQVCNVCCRVCGTVCCSALVVCDSVMLSWMG